MDIICAKCGRHFSSIEDAREHRGYCKETSKGESIRWLPAPKSKITPEEWKNLMKLINPQGVSPTTTPSNVEPTPIESQSPKDSAETKTSIPSASTADSKVSSDEKKAGKSSIKRTANYRIENWLIALLLIFALSTIGLGVSLFAGFFIPFWILFIFSLIYSIEKWFNFPLRKHKPIGKLYRLFLNLCILSLLGLIIWSGIKLFSNQFTHSSLVGSLIFLAEFVCFIWMWRVVAKNSWRWPSMKLTIFSLICLFVIFAFAGVNPFSNYKDNIFSFFKTSDISQATDSDNVRLPDKDIRNVTPTPLSSEPSPPVPEAPKSTPPNEINYYFYYGLVKYDGLYISGTDGLVILINNKNAKNPTYQELENFLNDDDTDSYTYRLSPLLASLIYGDPHDKVDKKYLLEIVNGATSPPPPNICADFAEMLHNNAEIAGIRVGYVCTEDHAFNVFETTDKGLVYIDDTGESIYPIPLYTPGSVTFGEVDNCDKVAYVEIGKPFGLISLNVAHLYGFNYEGYEKWLMKKELFDNKSDEYDRILNGRLYVSEAEYTELNRKMDELIALSDELGGFWDAGDIVGNYDVIWDGE